MNPGLSSSKKFIAVIVVMVFLVSAAFSLKTPLNTQEEWFQGGFDGTSAGRADNSGELGIGYNNGTVPEDVQGFWRFNSDSAIDSSIYNNDGTLGSEVVTGQKGVFDTKSYLFNGSGNQVSVPHSESLNNQGDITISFWTNIDNLTGSFQDVIRKKSGDREYWIYFGPNGDRISWSATYEDCGCNFKGESYYFGSNFNLTDGEWHHWTVQQEMFTSNGNHEIRFYRDGNLLGTNTVTDDDGLRVETEGEVLLGDIDGRLDEIKIIDGIRSEEWIREQNRSGRTKDDLEAFYRFDKNLGDPKDYSGNGNDFTTLPGDLTRGEEGVFGTSAFRFDGDDSQVERSNTDSLNITDSITLSFWAKVNSLTGSFQDVLRLRGDSTRQYWLYFIPDGTQLSFSASYRDCNCAWTGGGASVPNVSDGQWHHWVVSEEQYTGDGDHEIEFYMDGDYMGSTTVPASYGRRNSSERLEVGDINGKMDEVKIIRGHRPQEWAEDQYRNTSDDYIGNYTTKEIKYDKKQSWQQLETNSTVPADTSVDAVFQVSDYGFSNIKDSQRFTLSGGVENHDLNVQDAKDARIVFDGFSENLTKTWTVQSTEINYFRDFQVNDIELNESNFTEGESIEATVNVSNREPDSGDVKVEFRVQKYRNDTGWESFKAENKTFSSNGDDSTNLKYDFKANIGPHRIQAEADPAHKVDETNESNNQNSTLFDVTFYETFYGSTKSNIALGDNQKNIFYEYDENDTYGTIYFSDYQASYSLSDLKPLSSYDDLGVVDNDLNSTGFNDSIQKVWGNGSGIKETNCFYVSGSDLCDVPVSNSTNTSNFYTGILYDTADGVGYDGTQDLIFVTDSFKQRKQGRYGNYTYEARIPATLSNQAEQGNSIKYRLEFK